MIVLLSYLRKICFYRFLLCPPPPSSFLPRKSFFKASACVIDYGKTDFKRLCWVDYGIDPSLETFSVSASSVLFNYIDKLQYLYNMCLFHFVLKIMYNYCSMYFRNAKMYFGAYLAPRHINFFLQFRFFYVKGYIYIKNLTKNLCLNIW